MRVVDRRIPGDWYPGTVPANVEADETAYLGSSYNFRRYRSQTPCGLRLGRGASLCDGTLLDIGPRGSVSIGAFALISGGACIICDGSMCIGDYTLIAWNAVLIDSYRVPADDGRHWRSGPSSGTLRPMSIGPNAWIGFEACVLPGVSVGEGAVVAARAVVAHDVPPFTVVAGNPARIVRSLAAEPPSGAVRHSSERSIVYPVAG